MCFSVNTCCVCLSLDAGTKIISLFFTISSACILVVYGPMAALNDTLPPARLYFYVCLAVLAIVEIGIGGLLIRGAFKRKPQWMWPWIVLAWWKGIVLIFLSIAGAVALAMNASLQLTAENGPVIAAYFIYSNLLLYSAVIVNGRRQELVLENYWAERHVLGNAKTKYYYI
ncbi:unnamed protein product [Arctia plantaginis]|uniref:DUF7027 domain-containing protein n=1 Tax=Arctia plantaginis TaxID=874455 RepID=A0A8S0YU08_ARCPL|nr:unnamed protein product [Arctia plantaginis]